MCDFQRSAALFTSVIMLALFGMGGCEVVDTGVDAGLDDPCLSITSSESEKGISSTSQSLNGLSYVLWKTRDIPVCWEDDSYDSTDVLERQAVFDAVEQSWQFAFAVESVPEEYQFRFVGWTRCSEGNNTGIRIWVNDQGPGTQGLGTLLAGVPRGMVLNFDFKNWNTYCSQNGDDVRLQCIAAVAVHEFGHALGLAHEQNRDDTPEWCDETQGTDGDVHLGEWDLYSVMNYCNPKWNNFGELSANDLYWFRVMYYPEWAQAGCFSMNEVY